MPRPWLFTFTVVFLSLSAAAHGQYFGDEAPYFLWPDRWVGTVSGSEVLQREMQAQGAYLKMGSTATVTSDVTIDDRHQMDTIVQWAIENARAHATYRSSIYLNAGASSQVLDSVQGEGDVGLDGDPGLNGMTIDISDGTYILSLHSCTRAKCDSLTLKRSSSITAPGFAKMFADTKQDEQGVGVVAQMSLPDPGHGLEDAYAPAPQRVVGTLRTVRMEHKLDPVFDIASWANTYRASYVAARQGQIATFRDYAAANCGHGETTAPCRAARRAQNQLDENADFATADFRRVTEALIAVACPGFTRELNTYLERSSDVVLEGPIATYRAVREALFETVTSDPRVSFDQQPDFMRCLYDYDTYVDVVTLRLPGTSPIP